MRKLSSCETYAGSEYIGKEVKPIPKENLEAVITAGQIPLSALEESLEKIKKTPLYTDAEKALRENKIVLLCPQGSNGEYLLNLRIPFFLTARDKMYVNVTRSGRWSEDKQTYNISPASELSPVMQGAYITFKFLENADRLLSDPKIVEYATRIHVEMMVNLLQSFGIIVNNASQDDNTTYLRYLCAKFFLLYVLEKENSVSIDELAYKVAKTSSINRVSLELLQMREDGDGFLNNPDQYNTLSGFLMAVMELTRSNISISGPLIMSKVARLYGEPFFHGIVYFPYMLYFLEVTAKGGSQYKQLKLKLPNMRSLSAYLQQLEKEILAKV